MCKLLQPLPQGQFVLRFQNSQVISGDGASYHLRLLI